MSSSGDDGPSDTPARGAPKRRKVLQRACDYCRRKKIKCDGPRMPNKRCTKCISRRAECTYVEPFNKPRYPDSYVENLERRLQRMEEVLNKLNPGAEVLKTLEGESAHDSPSKATSEGAPSPSVASTSSLRVPHVSVAASSPEAVDDEDEFSDHDEVMRKDIINGMARLSLQPASLRYHGKSSGWVFIQATDSFRQEYIRETTPSRHHTDNSFLQNPAGKKYGPQPWLERPLQERLLAPEDFPPPDLMDTLVEHYFRHTNDYAPLLHEPTFLRNIKDKLHLRVPGFGATVLLACALGARYSDDPRVLLPGTDMQQSSGWKWFQRVDDMHKSFLAPVHVYDVQICAMATMYMQTTVLPHCSWITVGLGLRKIMDVGAHRKSMYKVKPSVEDELWRRAFWVLLVYEWGGGFGLGRPTCVHEEEYDVAFPTECDDEFWENDDPEQAFKQPPGKPSKVAFWNSFIRLFRIIAYATRTIFSIRKSRAQMVDGEEQWKERIVAELDSELNRWADTVPEHLKWNPNCDNELWLGQSATLFALYYQVQITVHRSFITSRRGSPHSLASLIICTNAARSCVQVLEQLYQRIGTPLARNSGALFNAGLVLLISVWGQRRSGRHAGADRDEMYIRKCMEMLTVIVRQHNVAERLRDMLDNFLNIDVPRTSAQENRSGADSAKGTDDTSSTSIRIGDGGGAPDAEEPSKAQPAPSPLSASYTGSPSQPPPHPTSDSAMVPETSSHPSTDAFAREGFTSLPNLQPAGPSSTSWQQPPQNSYQPQPQPSTDAHPIPGFAFPPLNPTSQAWAAGRQASSFGAAGQDVASQASNMAFSSSLSSFGFVDNGGAFPMDLSDFQGGLTGADTGGTDFGLPDCAFVDDTMTMWSNAPASFGWQDWDAYFNAVSGAQQPGSGS